MSHEKKTQGEGGGVFEGLNQPRVVKIKGPGTEGGGTARSVSHEKIWKNPLVVFETRKGRKTN